MKNKKLLWCLAILAAVLVGCAGFYRYQRVNAHPRQHGVMQEVVFHKNEWVHAYHTSFIIHKAEVQKTGREVKATIQLSIKQNGQPNYGMKKNNQDFLTNMFLNNPYGISNQSNDIYDQNQRRVDPSKALTKKLYKQPYTIYFTIPRSSYELREQKLRFSFLVPVKNHFVKYSLLLE